MTWLAQRRTGATGIRSWTPSSPEMSAQMDELRDKRELSSAGGGNPNWGSAEVQVFGMIFIASMCFG